jgi:ApbE superfamily uncharacterized protein (UPF0280 family)
MSPAEDMRDGGRAGRPGHWHAGVARAALPGGRWHFQHGPIDLVIAADGDPAAVGLALECAWERFQSVLTELAGELRLLRKPVELASGVRGSVAQRMVAACLPHRAVFITPMAAVAGAVADELIEAFRRQPGVERAYVNNGGDIALHLGQGQRYRVGLFADLGRVQRAERWRLDGDFELQPEVPARGVATSGWRGRSLSLGIADSVTVLAGTAAAADAAATLIANAVNVEDPAVVRRPACTLKDDTDLGERPVTVEVGTLSVTAVDEALDAGAAAAGRMLDQDLIWAATLWLQGRNRTRIG